VRSSTWSCSLLWPGAKISKGCGLVEFATADAASAAVHSLHHAFTWPHSHSPLIVEWVDSNRQASNRANKARSVAAAAAASNDVGASRRTLATLGESRRGAEGAAGMGMAASGNAFGFLPAGQQVAGQQQHLPKCTAVRCPMAAGLLHSLAAAQAVCDGSPCHQHVLNSSVLPSVTVPSMDSSAYRSGSTDGSGRPSASRHLLQQQQQLWWQTQAAAA